MSREDFRDKDGYLLGRIKEANGNFVLVNVNGKVLGRYNPKRDTTKDRSGKLIGKGNLLVNLLNNAI